MKNLLVVAMATSIVACSAALVPESNDPMREISQAKELLKIQRGIPAERLMRESIGLFEVRADKAGLALAKQEYALLLVHPSYRLYEKFWRDMGKYDSTNESAIAMMRSALDLYTEIDEPEGKRSTSFQLGRLYAENKDARNSCRLYDDSIVFHEQARKRYPDHDFYVAPGTKTWEETVALFKSGVPCP